jgi:hypothetical protein
VAHRRPQIVRTEIPLLPPHKKPQQSSIIKAPNARGEPRLKAAAQRTL